ncbi:SDR family oxidoreductase [Nocardia macrotermitis]|nr:SDR family oxidoreductase [Nocardia macrotermitis]
MADERDLAGRVVVVTGANSGIGRAVAADLARRGATTILACRNPDKARAAVAELRELTGNESVRSVELDLADLRSVERCAGELIESIDGIDVLVNNAGGAVPERRLTAQGVEETFASNYLGHYALTRLLLAHLRRDPQARVVNVSSNGHKYTKGIPWDDPTYEHGYGGLPAYGTAKLAQILFTRELAHRFGESGIHASAIHPGFIGSNFYARDRMGGAMTLVMKPIVGLFAKTPEQGARTVIQLATSDDVLSTNGAYWANGATATASAAATDDESAKRLWELSERMVTDGGVALPAA